MGLVFETRFVIGTADCDALGHMNVARYFALCNQNGSEMQSAMGWVPGECVGGQRLSFAVVRAESDFKAEVLEGEVLIAKTSITDIGNRSATFRNIIERENGTVVFQSDWISVLMDLDARNAAPIPDSFRQALEQYQEQPIGADEKSA